MIANGKPTQIVHHAIPAMIRSDLPSRVWHPCCSKLLWFSHSESRRHRSYPGIPSYSTHSPISTTHTTSFLPCRKDRSSTAKFFPKKTFHGCSTVENRKYLPTNRRWKWSSSWKKNKHKRTVWISTEETNPN